MAEYNSQRFYWIKLTDRFMTSDTVDFLMGQKDGANYVVLYQMLCLKTVNNNGELSRQIGEIIIPYDAEKISRDMKYFSIDTIRVAMELYKKLGLVYEQDNGVLRISDFDRMIGSQTISAEKKMIQRETRKLTSGQKEDKCPLDIDKEKDKDIKKEIHKESDKANEEDFSMFWELYPRKVNKEEAKKSFLKTKEKEFDLILYALNRFKQTEWKSHLMNKDEIQYIPHASTWLNQCRYKDFEDEFVNHRPIQEPQQFSNTSFNAEEFAEHNNSVNIKSKSLRRMQQEKFIADLGLEKAKEMMPSLFSDYEE